MKNIILICLLSFFAIGAVAQEPQGPKHDCPHMKKECISPKHEIGIGVVNLFQRPVYLYPWYGPYMDGIWYPYPYGYNEPALGLNYRYHQANGAFRVGLQLWYQYNENEYAYSESSESYLYTGLASGYEWHKDIKKTQIFYGADLFVNYRTQESESSDTTSNEYSSENTTIEFGVSPMVGVRYYFTPNLSVSTETQFRFSRDQTEWSSKYNNTTNKTTTTGLNMGFAPLGLLSLNIHF